ncbi:hypothetical protein ONZ45_g16491 [Pleurotus djamor]|nr:hypothetical protein ONZ45_g16491 [Pleurotus djamor]
MARAQNEGGHIDLSLYSFSRSLRSLLSRTMDHLKKLFKKDSLEEKGTSRRKVVRRSRSLPLGHQVEDEPRKATYRGRGPLRVSRIHHVEPEDRSLPNGYLGVPILDISKVTCDEAAKEWLNRKKVEREIRHPQTQKPLSSSLPRQRRHNHHHPEHNLREFTRLAKEDFAQLFAADDSDSYTTMSSQTDVDEVSFFKDKVRSDLQIWYDQSYAQPANRPLRGKSIHLVSEASGQAGSFAPRRGSESQPTP